jgi:RES domain-containing protein
MVYTAGTLSLAILELLVHTDSDLVPDDLLAYEIEIDDDIAIEYLRELPDRWEQIPAPEACQRSGDAWIEAGRGLILAVPSVVVPMEFNYLLNPKHDDMKRVQIISTRPFTFDHRLLG